MIRNKTRSYSFMGMTLLFLGVFLVWPMLHVFQRAFTDEQGFSLLYVKSLLTEPAQLEAIGTSFSIAVWVTIGCMIVALPLALLVARRSFPGKSFLSGLFLVPLILPPFVGAIGVKMIFARAGALSTLLMNLGLVEGPVDWLGAYPLLGIVLMEVLHLFPVLYLNLVAALANIDPTLEQAALNMGARPSRVLWRITLPMAAPGVFAGIVLVFIWSFTELGTPLVFGLRRVLPVMIYDSVSEVGTNSMGFAQVVFLLVVAATGFWVSKQVARKQGDVANLGRLSVASVEKPLRGFGLLAAYGLIGLVMLMAMLPHASVILLASSRHWFLSVLPEGYTMEFFVKAVGSGLTRQALVNSLLLSTCSTLVIIIVGFAIAWLCVRSQIRGADMLDTLAMLPLAIPGIVIAFGYLGCFSKQFPNTFLDPRHNPMFLLSVSYAIRRLPFMVRAAHAGLQQTNETYEEAAANLGASPWRVVRRVTLPLIMANLLAGGILCFTFSMLEVSDSMILAQSEEYFPITKAIYSLTETLENGVNVASALGVWAMALLAAAMLWASVLLGKKMGQMFRSS